MLDQIDIKVSTSMEKSLGTVIVKLHVGLIASKNAEVNLTVCNRVKELQQVMNSKTRTILLQIIFQRTSVT